MRLWHKRVAADGRRLIVELGIMALAMAITLILTWKRWPDALIDFGGQLYVPWQLLTGKRFYADVLCVQGPLTAHLHAWCFRLFGVGLDRLIVCNALVAVLITILLASLLRRLATRLATFMALLVFVTVFTFSQLTGIANYNLLCPYANELTHGLLLSLLSVWCLSRYHTRPRDRWIISSGLALGLCFLTKAEVFLAAAAALMVGWSLTLCAQRLPVSAIARSLAALVGSVLIPPLIASGLFIGHMSAHEAALAVLGNWPWIIARHATTLPLYRGILGATDPSASLLALLLWTIWLVLAVCVMAGCEVLLPVRWGLRRHMIVAGWITLAPWLLGTPEWWLWDVARPLPLLMAGLAAAHLRAVGHAPHDAQQPLILAFTFDVLAGLLLLKIGLDARIYHYGFVLAMPATLVALVTLIDALPRLLQRRIGHGECARVAAVLMAVTLILAVGRSNAKWWEAKRYSVGHGADRFLTDAVRGPVLDIMVREIQQRLRPDQTLAAVPGSVMINYLARRTNPLRVMEYEPFELSLMGEGVVLREFQTTPPDYVVLVERDTTEHGAAYFGRDYGRELAAWINRHYEEVLQVGARPFTNGDFGMILLHRRDAVSL